MQQIRYNPAVEVSDAGSYVRFCDEPVTAVRTTLVNWWPPVPHRLFAIVTGRTDSSPLCRRERSYAGCRSATGERSRYRGEGEGAFVRARLYTSASSSSSLSSSSYLLCSFFSAAAVVPFVSSVLSNFAVVRLLPLNVHFDRPGLMVDEHSCTAFTQFMR
jgi:hypothetical protein